MIYDPTIPAERQVQSWSCSVRTATFMLRSLGIDMDASRLEDVLVPDYVTPELGLLQGDGAGLAAVLADQSGCPTGHRWVDWAWLQAHAGTEPVGIGSGTLYHWTAVRGLNDDGTIALANPAPGYGGLGDVMTEAQFNHWAPWAGVWIEVPAESGGDDMADAALQAAYDELKTYTDALTQTILPSALGTMETAAQGTGTRKALANTVLGQCQAIRDAAGL